ncbi:GNAT family N-acetyltransferase [Streptomyces sp. NPDC001941]|uniref:GNAT family N-acetyltransferase n=1 Tax=Streptomyces sp. NPDC001941 TaxID=3154659 RepID=UPI00331A4F99
MPGYRSVTTAPEASMSLPAEAVRLTGEGIVLREWESADLPVMVELFDTPDVAARTPLRSPFDLAAAREYFAMIERTRAEGRRLHLAITADGGSPLGEVLISTSQGTMGYAVGPAHRGRGLAQRAGRLLVDYAHRVLGLSPVRLEIERDNAASIAVARAMDFRETGEAPTPVYEKGRSFSLYSWSHDAPLQ